MAVKLSWPQKAVLSVLMIPGTTNHVKKRLRDAHSRRGVGQVGSVLMGLANRGFVRAREAVGSEEIGPAIVWDRTDAGDKALWSATPFIVEPGH